MNKNRCALLLQICLHIKGLEATPKGDVQRMSRVSLCRQCTDLQTVSPIVLQYPPNISYAPPQIGPNPDTIAPCRPNIGIGIPHDDLLHVLKGSLMHLFVQTARKSLFIGRPLRRQIQDDQTIVSGPFGKPDHFAHRRIGMLLIRRTRIQPHGNQRMITRQFENKPVIPLCTSCLNTAYRSINHFLSKIKGDCTVGTKMDL